VKKTVDKQTNSADTRNNKKKITAIQHQNMPGFVTVAGERMLSEKFTVTKNCQRRGRTK
jgi:allophanate hydrolase subunit 2